MRKIANKIKEKKKSEIQQKKKKKKNWIKKWIVKSKINKIVLYRKREKKIQDLR